MTAPDRIFLDTAPIIYLVERKPVYCEKTAAFLSANPDADYLTSVISVTEYFPYPLRQENREELIRAFDRFIEEAAVEIIGIDRTIAMEAARIRAKYPFFKTMDSLQLAAALSCGCDLFLTNDKQLRQFDELPCLTLEDI